MKAISVLQPWASLLVFGAKQYETRAWRTEYRGPIIIHAGRRFPPTAIKICTIEPFHCVLRNNGIESSNQLSLGAILGVVNLDDCVRTDQIKYEEDDKIEIEFGDFRVGRWGWKMSNARRLAQSVPYQGRLGLFDIPDDYCKEMGLFPDSR